MKKKLLISLFVSTSTLVRSQILISLLFGDKLNKPGIEFGLDGGANFSTIHGLDNGESDPLFNLGFYFHFKLKNPSWMINTGVIVKSTMGATGLPVYSLNDTSLDSAFKNGTLDTKIGYFNVPILLRYKLKMGFCFELGTQLGLLTKVTNVFTNHISNGDLSFKTSTRDGYQPLDAGVTAGIGYQFPTLGGMHYAIRYYYGFVNISQDKSGPQQFNRTIYLTAGLPIGLGKANKKAAEEKE